MKYLDSEGNVIRSKFDSATSEDIKKEKEKIKKGKGKKTSAKTFNQNRKNLGY